MNSLERLNQLNTQIVADTGDIDLIKKYRPIDVTTNPSLILKVSTDDRFKHLLNSNDLEQVLVNFGTEISKEIEGYVSTEVNPKYSHNTDETIKIAKKIINLYQKNGISKERILIKIASTWQGIQAAKELEKEGIKCNMTLIFSLTQALACAQANVTLISPFVGRITDWYKEKGHVINKINDDFGVKNVKEIYNYYKFNNYKTIIMGASFRNIEQIKALAGLEKLTISPKLIDELSKDTNSTFIENLVDSKDYTIEIIKQDSFETKLNNDEMAQFKLNEGINKFVEDTNILENLIK
jgi:transaldolase